MPFSLVASILGDRYGVEVVICGNSAMTDGNTIYLPDLPMECDDEFLGLLRGLIDHESAHIRYSNFELLKKSNLTDFEKYVWNCIEDWRIEKKMSTHFAGCKYNFHWLIRHFFGKEVKMKNQHNRQKYQEKKEQAQIKPMMIKPATEELNKTKQAMRPPIIPPFPHQSPDHKDAVILLQACGICLLGTALVYQIQQGK